MPLTDRSFVYIGDGLKLGVVAVCMEFRTQGFSAQAPVGSELLLSFVLLVASVRVVFGV